MKDTRKNSLSHILDTENTFDQKKRMKKKSKTMKNNSPKSINSSGSKSSKTLITLESFELIMKDQSFLPELVDNINGNYSNYVSSALKFLKKIDIIDYKKEIFKKSITLPDLPANKKTLILDLDETLIHTDYLCQFKICDLILDFKTNEKTVKIPVIFRPYLFDFLDFCVERFEIFVFTASKKEYADSVLNFIEKDKKYFSQRFYRDNCISIKNLIFLKDLRIFSNRKLKDLLIIDNSLYSFANQLSNGILITSFYSDLNDVELMNLKNYLLTLLSSGIDDFREINSKMFNFEKIKQHL